MDYIVDTDKLIVFAFTETAVLNKKYYFKPDSGIANGIVDGLRIPYGNEITTSFNNFGQALTIISGAQIAQFNLTLVDKKGHEYIKDCPAYTFTSINNNGQIRRFHSEIDLSKSYLKFNNTTGIFSGVAILFDFNYTR